MVGRMRGELAGLASVVSLVAACATTPAPVPPPAPAAAPHELAYQQTVTFGPHKCPPPAADTDAARRAAALYQRACEGGDSDGCVAAARAALCATGADRDPLRALGDLDRACTQRTFGACTSAGMIRLEGSFGIPKDVARGAEQMKQACDGGDASGCANLGWCYSAGLGVPIDQAHAERLSISACEDGGSLVACSNLGLFAINARDGERALKYAGRACDRGYMVACANLTLVYLQGIGVPKDETKAAAYAQRACTAGNVPACANLGTFYMQGIGVARDTARGAKLFLDACERGSLAACDNAGIAYKDGLGVPQDLAKARALFQRACDGGISSGCTHLAKMIDATQGT